MAHRKTKKPKFKKLIASSKAKFKYLIVNSKNRNSNQSSKWLRD